MDLARPPLCVFKDIVTVLLRWKIDADLTEPPLISRAPSLCAPSMPCWDWGGSGRDGWWYSAEVIPWLMGHVCLRPCCLLTARIIIVIMWQLKRKRSIRTGGGGLWSERWMCADYKAVGNALRWQSILTPPPPPTVLRQSCRLLTPVLIDIHSQSILLRCRKNRSKSTQDARDRTCGRENQKAVPNERP